jgi:hypothetical protein
MKGKEEYFFNIHHRSIDVKEGITGEAEQGTSPGHLYLGLQKNSDKELLFGKYPEEGNLLFGKAKIETKKEERKHEKVVEYSKKMGKDYIFDKQIRLTKGEYENAMKYATDHSQLQNGHFVIGVSDCTDFVQSVYNAAGLPLYFTTAYSKQELVELDTWAVSKVLMKYASRDTIKEHLGNVSGFSKEQLASTLNISVDKISQVLPDIDLSLNAYDWPLPKFKVTLEDSDLLPLEAITDKKEVGLDEEAIIAEKQESKTVDSIIGAKIIQFKKTMLAKIEAKFSALLDKFKIKAQNDYDNQENGLLKKSQAELNDVIDKLKKQAQTEYDEMVIKKQVEHDQEFGERVAIAQANTEPGVKIKVSSHDIVAKKQAELNTFKEIRTAQLKSEVDKYTKQLNNEFSEDHVKLKDTIETKMSEKKEGAINKYNKNINDYLNKDVKSIIEILNSDVNIENIIEQQAEVFLQGVAVELISEL